MNLQEIIKEYSPKYIHELAISIFNYMQFKVRRGGNYKIWKDYYNYWEAEAVESWEVEQERRFLEFIGSIKKNTYWSGRLANVQDIETLAECPILRKDDIVKNLEVMRTVSESDGIVGYTGGTTGASLKVIYTKEDLQERYAVLDHFREHYGYTGKEKTAWFSGKDLLSSRDLKRGIYWKTDRVQNIRYFSTMHLTPQTFESYWKGLEKWNPVYMVGFPSFVTELCRHAKSQQVKYRGGIDTYFPTAENFTLDDRELINEVLGCSSANQYASSEGAPFICECQNGALHLNPLTGVFEVLDEAGLPAIEGELYATSFSTRATPLVRYKTGDSITLSQKPCGCGCTYPVVARINGRVADYVISEEKGLVSSSNLSNSTKKIKGIIKFQIIQNKPEELIVKVIHDASFDHHQESEFLGALRTRTGSSMKIVLERVKEIDRTSAGKHRFIVNNISGD